MPPFTVALIVAAAVSGAVALSPAFSRSTVKTQADPPCAQYDTCKYMPNPYNNGPLMPVWELPGGYGFPGGDPVMCDPQAYKCYPAVPGSGF